ncbi:PDZ and LIM domain protein 2-like isoform X2 [Toxorhynchites rutilus septentrionalis]|uniref:PDZ and LIM domain protein 2-like isoform X2 n=1 Tax=Toxorhynchites rutilus septentrionalis TaxID=329112 RepID=UPI00247A844F|nr:PDZ and LIM domain protein 2-like isoform X2 [Toxorhynchites rutilus septentrionalis]
MPEFVIEKRNFPVLTIASNSVHSGNGNGDNPMGFRITGGADFEMPITVFQVREYSPAEKAGLKLGDEIVKINGADASAMRLATAESVIKQAGEQLHLIVAKGDEDAVKNPDKTKETREIKFAVYFPEHASEVRSRSSTYSPTFSPQPRRSPSCESCEYTNAAVVEEQLRQMQKQLNEISIIPMQIQATLSYLTKALAKYAPPEVQRELPRSLRSSSVRETIPEEVEEPEMDIPEESDQEDLAECLEMLYDESEVLDVIPPRCLEYEYQSEENEEMEQETETSEEERLKQEKQERVSKLERAWPWSQTAKPIHKRSNCHLVPSMALEKSKIKQFMESELMFYNRGYRQRIGN